jgi:hypothetical protein
MDAFLQEEWEIATHLESRMVNSSASLTDMMKHVIGGIVNYDKSPHERLSLATYWLFLAIAELHMDFSEVSAMYFAKNLLNEYRQLRGYKDPSGNYPKIVNGIEDNVRFLAIVKEIGADDPYLREKAFAKMDATSLRQNQIQSKYFHKIIDLWSEIATVAIIVSVAAWLAVSAINIFTEITPEEIQALDGDVRAKIQEKLICRPPFGFNPSWNARWEGYDSVYSQQDVEHIKECLEKEKRYFHDMIREKQKIDNQINATKTH